MSDEDYVQHIKSKYQLAVALAVMKTKPNNITTETHLNSLIHKINSSSNNNDLESVCSNDFLFENDDNDVCHNDSRQLYNIQCSDETYCSDNVYNKLVIFDNHNDPAVTKKLSNNDNVMVIDNSENQCVNFKESTLDTLNVTANNNTINRIIIDSVITDVTEISHNHHKNDLIDNTKNNDDYLSDILRELNELDSTTDNYISQSTFCESSQDHSLSLSQDHNYFANISREHMNKNVKNIDLIDSQETVLCSLPDSFTHYSQSQTQNIVIGDKLIRNRNYNRNNNNIINSSNNDNNGQINASLCNNNEEFITNDNDITCSLFSTDCSDKKSQNNKTDLQFNSDNVNNDNFEDYDLSDSQKELIPFKVIDEMNKIKTILHRKDAKRVRDGYSSDSGYKSDAQIKGNTLQQSNKWMQQGGHCLFSHITSCSLLSNTEDITNEVSQVLGNLIDALHEEEIYPEFFEELLNYIELTVKSIYEEGDCDNVLLNKDEKTQRILLLNKSTHIQQYTIDKLLNTITDLHEKLKIDETEIKQIILIENSCYIFHLLELIITKYIRKRNLFSQNSSQSDDERSLKRSSLTEIWRKKWIPNYREVLRCDVTNKVCVETKCSEVLNKIIVECMDGYSLLSYSALKCFNLLQP